MALFWANTFHSKKSENVTFLGLLEANLVQKIREKLMAGSMRTFVTDGQRDNGQTELVTEDLR